MTTLRGIRASDEKDAGPAGNGRDPSIPLSKNGHLLKWVEKMARLTQPAAIHWVDGSREEIRRALRTNGRGRHLHQAQRGTVAGLLLRALRRERRRAGRGPHLHLLVLEGGGGPTNNWEDPFKMRRKLKELFGGSMRGRTMYVLPFSMGPVGSPMSQIGVQLTDSPYVVVSMRIMARIGLPVFAEIDKGEKRVVPCMHTVGAPLAPGQQDVALAVQPGEVHRPLPGDARDLVLRLRLRRQRAARQEVLRATDRLEHRARRGLDGRAHAHPRGRRPARARRPTSPPRSPPPAARRTSPC